MRRGSAGRLLVSLGITATLVCSAPALATPAQAAVHSTALGQQTTLARPHLTKLTAAQAAAFSQKATRHVIIILRDQHGSASSNADALRARSAAIAGDQVSIAAELAQVQAANVHRFSVINAISATVSAAEAARLASNPLVRAVVPDRLIAAPRTTRPGDATSGAAARGATAAPAANSAACTSILPSLEPEALQITNTAFQNPLIPSAQNLLGNPGAGETVAFIADGLDINNPDFQRGGHSIFVDYQDFSGDGPNAATGGAEAFGDASAIAAQGNTTYDLNTFVDPAFTLTPPCNLIKIRGMAPGASLIGLKVFPAVNGATQGQYNSVFVQAIEYAVTYRANHPSANLDVLNESFGGNSFPDDDTDPTVLANDAAVAAGITIVASTGDSGVGDLGTPASDPLIISSGATTDFRAYSQFGYGGIRLGNGSYVSTNMSAFSSADVNSLGNHGVDTVAPGDRSWALCSAATDGDSNQLYTECTNADGNPVNFQDFGGTSASAPITSGEAALVIQAYRNAHGGIAPSPALVKQIITSTATDLGIPPYQQGAGLINSLKAVQAALSIKDANGTPPAQGKGLLVSPNTFNASGAPGSSSSFQLTVKNVGSTLQVLTPQLRALRPYGDFFLPKTYTTTLNYATAPTFVHFNGRPRSYVEQDFTLNNFAERVDVNFASDQTQAGSAGKFVALSLFDPSNRLVAWSYSTNTGWGHVDLRNAVRGTYRAIVSAYASVQYVGAIHLTVATSAFLPAPNGGISPAFRFLLPGGTTTFTVNAALPTQPGDQVYAVQFTPLTNITGNVAPDSAAGAVPVFLRAVAPLGATGGQFSGTVTGGNVSLGDIQTFAFDVPAGKHDLSLGFALDPSASAASRLNYGLEGVLVNPDGLPVSTQYTGDPNPQSATGFVSTMQFFRRDPEAGRWRLIVFQFPQTSGLQTSIGFTVNIAFDAVRISAGSGLPTAGTVLPRNTPHTFSIDVTNTGNTTKYYSLDPRLSQITGFASALGDTVTLPNGTDSFYVPTETNELYTELDSPVAANLEVEYSQTGTPDFVAPPIHNMDGSYTASLDLTAPELPAGFWLASPSLIGPFASPAPSTDTSFTAIAYAEDYNADVTSSTDDVQFGNTYTPLVLAPGQSGTITVTISPTGTAGTVVSGNLYVDTFDALTGNIDEVKAIPYGYTTGS